MLTSNVHFSLSTNTKENTSKLMKNTLNVCTVVTSHVDKSNCKKSSIALAVISAALMTFCGIPIADIG